MTETNAVIGARDGEQRPGTMGRVMPGYEAKIVDEDDNERARRHRRRARAARRRAVRLRDRATGGMPELTVESWRNLWFHTGDRAVRDPDGSSASSTG